MPTPGMPKFHIIFSCRRLECFNFTLFFRADAWNASISHYFFMPTLGMLPKIRYFGAQRPGLKEKWIGRDDSHSVARSRREERTKGRVSTRSP
jgi:hypothetical protein